MPIDVDKEFKKFIKENTYSWEDDGMGINEKGIWLNKMEVIGFIEKFYSPKMIHGENCVSKKEINYQFQKMINEMEGIELCMNFTNYKYPCQNKTCTRGKEKICPLKFGGSVTNLMNKYQKKFDETDEDVTEQLVEFIGKKKPLGLFVKLLDDEHYEYGINTKEASFKQLSYILSCLKVMEHQLVEHLSEIEPEIEINYDGVLDEENN